MLGRAQGQVNRIYLDYNATTPLCDAAREAMAVAMAEAWGNPSSVHREGQRARAAVEHARGQIAALVGVSARELVFTSGATEAINHVHRGLAPWEKLQLTSLVEHPAVHAAADRACAEGRARGHVKLGVDERGRLDLGELEDALRSGDVGLVSIMLVNNELGNGYPLAEVAELCEAAGALCHTDATQAVGRIPVSLPELGVHLASFSAHKLYGPKGIGALWGRPGVRVDPWLVGGPQERVRRPGTENVLGAVGFGAAAEWVAHDLEVEAARQRQLRDGLLERLLALGPLTVNGDPEHGAPGTLNVSFPGCEAEALLMALDLEGVAVSAGAACSSGSLEPSHVLEALTEDRGRRRSAVRFSLGRMTREAEIAEAMVRLGRVLGRLRG